MFQQAIDKVSRFLRSEDLEVIKLLKKWCLYIYLSIYLYIYIYISYTVAKNSIFNGSYLRFYLTEFLQTFQETIDQVSIFHRSKDLEVIKVAKKSWIWPSVTFDDLEGQIQIMAYNIIWTLNFPTSHRWSVYLS